MLAAHLLHEVSRGSQSAWYPYIAQLPHEYTLLMNFSPKHIEALQVPHAQHLAQATCQQVQQQWTEARSLLTALGDHHA